MNPSKILRTAAALAAFFYGSAAFAQANNPLVKQGAAGAVPWLTELRIGGSAISTSNPVPTSIQSGGIAAGTAGTPSTDVVTIQAPLSGGVPLPFSSSDAAPVTTSAVTASGDVVTIDTTGYQSLTIQVIQYGAGSVAVTGSNDGGTTWSGAMGVLSTGSVSSSLFNGTSSRYGAEFKLIKITVTYTSGTFQFAYRLSNSPQPRVTSQTSLLAAETHIGEIGLNAYTSTATPTTTAVTYTVGQSAGGLLTFTNMARVSGAAGNPGTGGAVKSAIVANKSTLSSGGWDLWLFNANPTGSTCTNATAWSLAAADIGKVVGVLNFNAGNTSAAGTVFLPSSIAGNGNSSLGSGIWYTLSSSTSMYGCLVARASMAVGTTSDLSISLMTNRL